MKKSTCLASVFVMLGILVACSTASSAKEANSPTPSSLTVPTDIPLPSPALPTPTSSPSPVPLSDAAMASCPVTLPNGSTTFPGYGGTAPGATVGVNHGNGALWTYLWADAKVIYRPGGPGIMHPDGSLQMKLPWWRAVEGQLTIEGRRLDGPAPPLRANIPEGYRPTGFQATGIIFPTEGCWEVTAKAGEASLTFVVLVIKE